MRDLNQNEWMSEKEKKKLFGKKKAIDTPQKESDTAEAEDSPKMSAEEEEA